jgi:hypothetical protein
VGDKIVPQFETGTLNQWEVELIKPDDCNFINDEFVATAPGQCIITMRLKNRPAVTHTTEIVINAAEQEFVAYIDGPDKLRLDRQGEYVLKSNAPLEHPEEVEMSIQSSPSEKDSIRKEEDNLYIIRANAKNKLG